MSYSRVCGINAIDCVKTVGMLTIRLSSNSASDPLFTDLSSVPPRSSFAPRHQSDLTALILIEPNWVSFTALKRIR